MSSIKKNQFNAHTGSRVLHGYCFLLAVKFKEPLLVTEIPCRQSDQKQNVINSSGTAGHEIHPHISYKTEKGKTPCKHLNSHTTNAISSIIYYAAFHRLLQSSIWLAIPADS